jgi:uncharacterized protein (DUF1330 family)
MATPLIAQGKIKNPAKLQQYSAAAGPIFGPFGGAPVARGKVVSVLTGSHAGDAALVAKFPNTASARGWYESQAYQALIPLRDQAIEATFVLHEEPACLKHS